MGETLSQSWSRARAAALVLLSLRQASHAYQHSVQLDEALM